MERGVWKMILNKLFEVVGNLFMALISLFNIPGIPNDVLESAYHFLDLLFSNASLLGLFVRINTIKQIAVILIILLNFKHIYNLGKWILSKIPFFKK